MKFVSALGFVAVPVACAAHSATGSQFFGLAIGFTTFLTIAAALVLLEERRHLSRVAIQAT